MNLDLRPLLKGETARMGVDIFIEPESPAGVELTDRAHLVGEVTNRLYALGGNRNGALSRRLRPVPGSRERRVLHSV